MNSVVLNKRPTNISMEQKQILLEFMKKHPRLSSGKFSNEFTQKNAQRLWEDVTNTLNSCGTTKEWKSWRKTWQDIRSRTKMKNSVYNKHQRGTGGGPCLPSSISKFENEVLNTIKLVAVKGHTEVSESQTHFRIGSENESDGCIENDLEDELSDENTTLTSLPKTDIENVSVMNSNEPSSSKKRLTQSPRMGMKKKFPRAPRKKLVYASEASENYRLSLEKKNNIKYNYYEKKNLILERLAAAKERSAAAIESSAAAIERSAAAMERSSDALEDISCGIKDLFETFC